MKTISHQNKVYPQEVEIPAPLEIHPSVSALAAELLMKTAHRLLVNPTCYQQALGVHECGAPCCIIGHMNALAGLSSSMNHDPIGLTETQHQSLFKLSRWPRGISCSESMQDVTASEGIARIEHFLRTGE